MSAPLHPRGGRRLLAVFAATTLAALSLVVGANSANAATDPAGFVNTLIGTDGGETFPGADTPFGMTQWSPEGTNGNQTRTASPSGYSYNTTRIRGFGLTHLSGIGCAGASGDIPFLPYVGAVTSSPSADSTDATYASSFSHANETGTAGYYRTLLGNGTNVELTASTHTGSARLTYPSTGTASLLVRTANSEVGSSAATTTIDTANRTISGSVTSGNFCGYINGVDRRSYYTLHFYAVFDQPFTATGTWVDGSVRSNTTSATGATTYGSDGWPVAGRGSGGYVTFASGQTVNVRVGISYVSDANAQANLAAENPGGTTFDTIRQRAHDAWNTELGRAEITGGTTAQLQTFYTALYHALLHPNVFSDVNGQYMGIDQQVKTVSGAQHAQYANFSGWDVYRDELQLVTLLRPDVGGDIAQSLYNQATANGGVWDRWTHNQGGTHVMTGDPAHSALPSIYAFGGTNFDAAGALTSMVHAATTVTADDLSRDGWNVMVVGERPSLDKWLAQHYIPNSGNAWGGAGESLEDSIADFGISQLAQRLGQTPTHDTFAARAQFWKNVYNPATGYIQERNDDGSWPSSDPAGDDGFAEGSSAQYTWMVQHNVRGLFDKMGGNANANTRLDTFFHQTDGSWALTNAGGLHSELDNEPSIAVPWLYNFSGKPYKTQQTVRQTVNTLWSNAPGGIPGQDDLGAMSSWYVFSALGMYPLTPGRAELLLSSPLFPKAVIHRGNGVDLTINAPGAAAGTSYIQSLSVNGTASNRAWLPESFIATSGTLDYALGTSANTTWAAAAADTPPSFDTTGAPANDFSVAVSPGSGAVNPGGSTTSVVSTGTTSGSAQTVQLAASGLPAGASAGFSPSSVTSGGSSTMTITITSATLPGTYPVTITGTGASGTHTTTYALTVNGSTGPANNLALNRAATGSASCNTVEGPAKAVNGTVSGGNSDKWCSLAASKWLQVDLGSAVGVGSFVVQHAGAGGEPTTYNTSDFTVQVSADGASWTTVVTVTANTASTTNHAISPTTARYVRLDITKPEQGTGGAARIYELEVYAPVGSGTNLALNRTATGSTACNSDEVPQKAVTGNVTDKWCSLAASKWLQVDLGSAVGVGSFVVQHAGAGGEPTTYNTSDFTVQVSADGASWTTVVTVTANTASTTNHAISPTTARYVRLDITKPEQGTGGAARIYELEVYGP